MRILAFAFTLAACAGHNDEATTQAAPVMTSQAVSAQDPSQIPIPVPDTPLNVGPAGQGLPCQQGACAEGLTCVEYYGIAGPSGPKLSSCEIPCPDQKTACPQGQTCVTIPDGPGPVCRP